MNIAIDLRRITEFGVGTYTRNILRALARLDRENTYHLIGTPQKIAEIDPMPPNFRPVPLRDGVNPVNAYFDYRGNLKNLGCDLVHIPHLFWWPRGIPCRYVMTVHDVLDHLYRDHGRSGFRRSVHFHMTRQVLKGADRIFAVSNFTKVEIEKLFDICPDKIQVIYNAIDERFLHGHATDSDRQFLAERYQVNYPFLLYAGRISPQKNLVRIIEAFSALKGELEKDGQYTDLKLIIIGDELSKHPDLRRTVIRSGVQNDVRFLGFVPIETLRIFYDVAKIFVFPSLYEGFGLPPLEAMAHGTPVLTSNSSSLPEVVGNAAVLVNPENIFEIRRALHRVLLDQTFRERLKERGYAQAQKFSWATSAAEILQAYKEIVADRAYPQKPQIEH